MATAVLRNFALIHREQDFHEDIDDENIPFDIFAAADSSGNAQCQPALFPDTLLNKITDLMKLHVRFIDNKMGKRKKTFTATNLINPLILLF